MKNSMIFKCAITKEGLFISQRDLLIYLFKVKDIFSGDPKAVSIKNTIQIIIDQIESIEEE